MLGALGRPRAHPTVDALDSQRDGAARQPCHVTLDARNAPVWAVSRARAQQLLRANAAAVRCVAVLCTLAGCQAQQPLAAAAWPLAAAHATGQPAPTPPINWLPVAALPLCTHTQNHAMRHPPMQRLGVFVAGAQPGARAPPEAALGQRAWQRQPGPQRQQPRPDQVRALAVVGPAGRRQSHGMGRIMPMRPPIVRLLPLRVPPRAQVCAAARRLLREPQHQLRGARCAGALCKREQGVGAAACSGNLAWRARGRNLGLRAMRAVMDEA